MTVLTDLRARRNSLLSEMRAIQTTAAERQRDLTDLESERFLSIDREVIKLDERIEQLEEQARAVARSDAAFDQLRERPVTGPTSSGAAGQPGGDLDAQLRRMQLERDPRPVDLPATGLRSGYQPGLERRSLLTTSGSGMVPTSFYDQLMRHLVENSAVLAAGATVVGTPTGEPLKVPRSSALSTAAITTEGSAISTSDPTLGSASLSGFKYSFLVQCSYELLRDATFDVVGFLAANAAQAIALAWGNHAINGTGTGQPRGILLDTTVGVTGPTGTATSLGTHTTVGQGGDLLADLIASVADPYVRAPAAGFLMRNASLNIVRKLRDSQGRYVFNLDAPAGSGAAGTIFGKPVFIDPFVPAMAANAKSIIFGDWSRVYVRQVGGLRFERSDDFAFGSDLSTYRCIFTLDSALIDTTGALKHFANSAT